MTAAPGHATLEQKPLPCRARLAPPCEVPSPARAPCTPSHSRAQVGSHSPPVPPRPGWPPVYGKRLQAAGSAPGSEWGHRALRRLRGLLQPLGRTRYLEAPVSPMPWPWSQTWLLLQLRLPLPVASINPVLLAPVSRSWHSRLSTIYWQFKQKYRKMGLVVKPGRKRKVCVYARVCVRARE